MPTGSHTVDPLQAFVDRLHECHELSVYEAIERLIHAAEEVGLGTDSLLQKLGQGMNFEELLELIETRLECLQKVA